MHNIIYALYYIWDKARACHHWMRGVASMGLRCWWHSQHKHYTLIAILHPFEPVYFLAPTSHGPLHFPPSLTPSLANIVSNTFIGDVTSLCLNCLQNPEICILVIYLLTCPCTIVYGRYRPHNFLGWRRSSIHHYHLPPPCDNACAES